MFEKAAKSHWLWASSVGGGSATSRAKLHGMGTVLDERHTLTALHCWSRVQQRYQWPVVLRTDGMFRCEVAFASEAHDLLILRNVAKLDSEVIGQITSYPEIDYGFINLGASVAFVSRLTLLSKEGEERHTHLAAGFVSMMLPDPDNDEVRYALSGTVMQKGFSGSAVFRPSGGIVGVVVEVMGFKADFKDPAAPRYQLPVISPLYPVAKDIQKVLQQA